jgi:hypothetical protein
MVSTETWLTSHIPARQESESSAPEMVAPSFPQLSFGKAPASVNFFLRILNIYSESPLMRVKTRAGNLQFSGNISMENTAQIEAGRLPTGRS